MSFFCSSLRIIDFLSEPIIILSFAKSNSACDTFLRFFLAANKAASLTRLARSAPEKPGVPLAITFDSTDLSTGTFFKCTLRICSLPLISGKPTITCLSNLPGLKSAASRTSGRFVAAITITPRFSSKPSISTNNWLSVCSLSSCPPPKPAPLCLPTASISSIKTIHGECFFACSNISRTLEAPTPTNISTKSEPEIVKNGTLASPATALASKVFPVPGGPTINIPRGIFPPTFMNFAGSLRKSTSSLTSSFASSHPATSVKFVFTCPPSRSFALLLPKVIGPPLPPTPPCIFRMNIKKIANRSNRGNAPMRSCDQTLGFSNASKAISTSASVKLSLRS